LNFWSWHIQINQKSWNTEILQNSIEFRYDFKKGTQSSVMNFFTTTNQKNVIGTSFYNQIVVLINKTLDTNFGSGLTEIWFFEIDALKSIENHEIWIYYRILSNLTEFLIRFQVRNVIFSNEIFFNHLFKKYDKYTIR